MSHPDSIFIVEPQGYAHHCFEEVALGLHYGAKELGFDWPIHRGPVPHGTSPLILGACLLPSSALDPIPKDAIIFNMEQCKSPWINQRVSSYIDRMGNHKVWDCDPFRTMQLQKLHLDAKCCQIGYVPELATIEPTSDQDIDVMFYGSLNDRRKDVINELRKAGVIVAVPNAPLYGKARDEIIARSKILLNVHFYEHARFEMVRVSYLLANRKCVVSEVSLNDDLPNFVAWSTYKGLADKCLELLANPAERERIAQNGFDTFSKMKQSDYLGEALCLQPQPA